VHTGIGDPAIALRIPSANPPLPAAPDQVPPKVLPSGSPPSVPLYVVALGPLAYLFVKVAVVAVQVPEIVLIPPESSPCPVRTPFLHATSMSNEELTSPQMLPS
jgi:hypothetical protein